MVGSTLLYAPLWSALCWECVDLTLTATNSEVVWPESETDCPVRDAWAFSCPHACVYVWRACKVCVCLNARTFV